MRCPLCRSSQNFENWPHSAWKKPRFFHCAECDAVFVPETEQVSLEKERERYETHQNGESQDFHDFLRQTVSKIAVKLPKGSRILDFGSGPDPEPQMAKLLREAGYEVVAFDPFFKKEKVEGEFELILAHEVFEHLRNPNEELDKIRSWLKPDGIFLIRSEPRPPREKFASWWYARDFTHIFFASEKTLEWIAEKKNWRHGVWSPVLWYLQKS